MHFAELVVIVRAITGMSMLDAVRMTTGNLMILAGPEIGMVDNHIPAEVAEQLIEITRQSMSDNIHLYHVL